MDSNSDKEIHENTFHVPHLTGNSSPSSHHSVQSRISDGHTAKEPVFNDLGSKRVRHSSKGSDSEGFGSLSKEMNDDTARLIYINDPEKTNERFEFAGNYIRTSKYTFFTFLPRNLFEQFHRVAYIYFLVIAILNQLPQLAVFGRGASIMPLAFVLLVTAIKDAFEDYRRYRSDKIENNRLAWVLVNGEFQQVKWKHIRVGQVLKVISNDTLPCDMVLLSTSDSTGVAYVQTTNLDGESSLKTRYARQETQIKNIEKDNISGLIKCEEPHRFIYGFHGNMEIDGKRISLGPLNIMLRGCQLKNTDWVLGVAVYAGFETKAMLNNSGAPSKRSRLETRMNQEIICLSICLVALCTTISICHGIWLVLHRNGFVLMQFYRKEDYSRPKVQNYKFYSWGLEILFVFLMAVIVFQIMIPISLYISMELVRVGQAFYMNRDKHMLDEVSNSRFQCRAVNINEDLGQVKYVFSDKTGTLTENKMVFRCASIGGRDYSSAEENSEDGPLPWPVQEGRNKQPLKLKMTVKIDPELSRLSQCKNSDESRCVQDFFIALAACNTIVPVTLDAPDSTVKLIDYQGESPDEQALAYAAAAYGFMLVERTSGHLVIDIHGERIRFDVLGLHEFDSERKRMSVVLGYPDKTVKVFVKGADTSMFGIMDRTQGSCMLDGTAEHVHLYASRGLRTLVVGMHELSSYEFEHWQSSYQAASIALVGRAAWLRRVANSIEHNLRILGATGIEDKLQQGVPQAIDCLRKAGIKVLVLTGDKPETAISIGYSSKLLTSNMSQVVLNSNSMDLCRKSIQDALAMLKKFTTDSHDTQEASLKGEDQVALIIDGTSLVHILDTQLEDDLFRLSSMCSVVLCCRVAPMQKSGIVSMIKKRTDDMTLAIGDGANDVSMIQMADVGIGISGQEGRQAVMASDFSMGQFRFLVPLLLVHGHWNYQRMSYMILFNFYRNAVFVLILFWYALFTGFTLTTAITEWSSLLYSVLYTSFPTIVVGILDKDLSRRSLMKQPQLYGAGQREENYNRTLFWLTMVDTFWQSVAAFFLPFIAYWGSEIDASSLGDLWTVAAVVMVNINLAMDVHRWHWAIHSAIWGSIIATFICVMIIDVVPTMPGYWAFFHVAKTELFWICLAIVTVTALVPRFVAKVCVQLFCPSDIQIAREAEKFSNSRESQVEMSEILDPPRR